MLIIFRDLRTGQVGMQYSKGDVILNGGASRIRFCTKKSDVELGLMVRAAAGGRMIQDGHMDLLFSRLDRAEPNTWFLDKRHRKVTVKPEQVKDPTPTTPKLREFTTPPQRNLDTKPVRVEVIEGPVATPDVVVPPPPTRTDGGRSRNRAGRLTADQLAARRQGKSGEE